MRSPSAAEAARVWHTRAAVARAEAGSVTAEFAAVVPAVILVLACCLGGLQLATQQLRVQSAAASSARSIARGEGVDLARLLSGATATTERRGNLVCVQLSAPGQGFAGLFATVTLRASSCALAEGQ